MAAKYTIASLLVATCLTSSLVLGQTGAGGMLSRIPQTAGGVLASSADGMSRYLAPDGPIQPAITAIGALPLRGAEMANSGITSISSSLNNGAQSLSRAAGQNGNIRMPGMDALESRMPASIASLGGMMGSAIQQKNRFIMGQAEKGVAAGERLRGMMQNGLQGMTARSSGHMVGASNMMQGAQDAMMQGGEQIKQQLQQSLQGHMGRMEAMQGMGENMRNQAQGIGRTLTNGLTGAVEQVHRTGEQVMGQIQGGAKQNAQQMSGIMSSMQGSMGNMGQNMQNSLERISRQAQNALQQVQQQVHQAIQGPLNMLQGLGSKMMQGGGGSSSGGRY